jgi:hypothetical protein
VLLVIEVRREADDELCGYVDDAGGGWRALTMFGAVLGHHATREGAERQILAEGLSCLAGVWTLRAGDGGEDEVVRIQEASPAGVTVARGYYVLAGVPTLHITRAEIEAGTWVLTR